MDTTGTGGEEGLYGGDGSFLCGRFDRHNGFPAFGVGGADGKISGAPGTGILDMPHGLRADLTGQIDLEAGVNGDHPVVLANHAGVVDIAAGHQRDFRIVVKIFIKPLIA